MAETNAARSVATGTRRLAEAVRAAKIATAHRSDVVVDIREADRARLEMFAEELQPIVEAVPAEDDLFDFYLSGGPQPRFWIDGTAHVTMARDRRTYRFVRETRFGRVTLAESAEPRVLAERVTDYVAGRIVERDRAYALDDGMATRLTERSQHRNEADDPIRAPRHSSAGWVIAVSWLLIGVVLGAGLLLTFASLSGTTLI